jgi:hypothetical protein
MRKAISNMNVQTCINSTPDGGIGHQVVKVKEKHHGVGSV